MPGSMTPSWPRLISSRLLAFLGWKEKERLPDECTVKLKLDLSDKLPDFEGAP
jgi:hypothetical protein